MRDNYLQSYVALNHLIGNDEAFMKINICYLVLCLVDQCSLWLWPMGCARRLITLLYKSFGLIKFCLVSSGVHAAVCSHHTMTSHDLFESLFSQLQNVSSFESKAAHLRS